MEDEVNEKSNTVDEMVEEEKANEKKGKSTREKVNTLEEKE